MFGLFPIGIIASIILIIKNKKIDLFTVLLFIPYVIIGAFCIFKIPYLPQLTFLSYSSVNRAIIAIGYIDILILLRAISLSEKPTKLWISGLISLITSLVLVLLCKKLNSNYIGEVLATFLFLMCFCLFFTALQYKTKYGKFLFTFGIIITMLACGFTVNPISSGVNIINDSPILQAIKNINAQESGIWLVENIDFPGANYPVMAGASTINATNIYPNMELWQGLDKDKKYEEVYNRYAHIMMVLVEDENKIANKFELVTTDRIKVYVTPEDLKNMNIKYIFTVGIMENFNRENQTFELIYNETLGGNNYHIYKVNYVN